MKGFIPSAMRDAPYAGLFVASYENFKSYAEKITSSSSTVSSTAIHSASAAAAATLATFATQPFDVIKVFSRIVTYTHFILI